MRGRGTSCRITLGLALAVLLSACTAPRGIGGELSSSELPRSILHQGTLSGGEAIGQMRWQMQRAQRDMTRFSVSVESLQRRPGGEGFDLLGDFVHAYMARYVDPLLRSEWQSRHPELMGMDANLRLLKAQVLVQMGDRRRARRVIDEIESRYRGRENMMVEFPAGSRSTLGEALGALDV